MICICHIDNKIELSNHFLHYYTLQHNMSHLQVIRDLKKQKPLDQLQYNYQLWQQAIVKSRRDKYLSKIFRIKIK